MWQSRIIFAHHLKIMDNFIFDLNYIYVQAVTACTVVWTQNSQCILLWCLSPLKFESQKDNCTSHTGLPSVHHRNSSSSAFIEHNNKHLITITYSLHGCGGWATNCLGGKKTKMPSQGACASPQGSPVWETCFSLLSYFSQRETNFFNVITYDFFLYYN